MFTELDGIVYRTLMGYKMTFYMDWSLVLATFTLV